MITVGGIGAGLLPWVCHVCGERDDHWTTPRLCLPIPAPVSGQRWDRATQIVGVCAGECERKLKETLAAQETAEDIEAAFGDRRPGLGDIDSLQGALLDKLARNYSIERKTSPMANPRAQMDNETDEELRERLKLLLGFK